jgi:hypothetical protein
MRAFTLDSFDTQPGLRDDAHEPRVADDGLVVRVHASSVNPVDAFIAAGGLKEMAAYEFPVTLGRDFAGVVEQVGSGVSRYRVGDQVFGFVRHANPTVRDGSWAELIAVPEDDMVAPGPRNVDFPEAGAAPLAALAAVAAFDALAPAKGDGVAAILDAVSFTPDVTLLEDGGRLASPSVPPAKGLGDSTSMRSRHRRTSNAWPSSWTPARSASTSSAAIRSSERARRSTRCRRRTRRARSA